MAVAPFSDNIQVNAPKAIDNRYGKVVSGKTVPFDSLTEALNMIPLEIRFIGMTIPVYISGAIREYWWTTGAGLTAAPVPKTEVEKTNLPIEVELVGAMTRGKVSLGDGDAVASSTSVDSYSGFLQVTPGQKLRVTFRSDDFNSSPPIVGTGIAGYGAATEASFISTIDAKGLPIGNLMGTERFNAIHGTDFDGKRNFIDEEIIIPAGVNYVRGTTVTNDTQGPNVPLSIKVIKAQGTVTDSLTVIYDRLYKMANRINEIPEETVQTGIDFTIEDKQKLESLNPNSISKDGDGILFVDRGNGKTYRLYSLLGVATMEEIGMVALPTLRNSPYRFGTAIDQSKMTGMPGYMNAIAEFNMGVMENGATPSHLVPGLNTGFTKYEPGAGSLRYDWVEFDYIANYCIANNKKMHFSHLTWHGSTTAAHISGIKTAYPSNFKLIYTQYLQETITAIINRVETTYPDLVLGYNVTNEMVDDAGNYKTDKFWGTIFNIDEFLEITFSAAKATGTTAKLFCNDYGFQTGGSYRTDTYLAAVRTLKAKNIRVGGAANILVQVDGIGNQHHTSMKSITTEYALVKERMKVWDNEGMLYMISEFDTTTPNPYNDTTAELVANAWVKTLEAYEAAIRPALRYAFITWTPMDRSYIKNYDDAYNPIYPLVHFPALYDYDGLPKLAYQRVAARWTGAAEPILDVYQDFILENNMADIVDVALFTGGATPKAWQKSANAASKISINETGLGAAQSSSTSFSFAYIDYPFANRMMEFRWSNLWRTGTPSRTALAMVKYVDADNYIAVQATNGSNIYQLMKRKAGADVTLQIVPDVVPVTGDILKMTCVGSLITLYINGVQAAQVTETDFQGATKLGFKFKGYDDKFTRIEYLKANKI